MAFTFKPCSVAGCKGNASSASAGGSLGYCRSHYNRFRNHGDPVGGRTAQGRPLAWLQERAKYDGDDCLIWPFAVDKHGYASVTVDRRKTTASRVMCTLAHGEAPSPDHEAAHLCGKGRNACVSPKHLRWASTAENQSDKTAHGTNVRGSDVNTAKLTEDDVRKIRLLRGTMKQVDIARMFGIKQAQVSKVQLGQAWKKP